MLEKAIGETAGGGAAVQRDPPGYRHGKVIERGFQLESAATGVALAPAHAKQRVTRHSHAGLVQALPIDEHLSGQHPAPRLIFGFKDAALCQQRRQWAFTDSLGANLRQSLISAF